MKRLKRSGDKLKIKGFTVKVEKDGEDWILSISFLFFSVKINISDLINR